MSDEAHLPAEQSCPQTPSRLPRPDGDSRRPQGAQGTPGTRPQEALRVKPPAVLKKRSDFLAANAGRRAATPGFVLLVRDRQDGDPARRIGFTVSRKVGNAVVRNRMKRRLRALANDLIPSHGYPGCDHVIIGRSAGIERDFELLSKDLQRALERVAI
jgi:ribonuclease P protein component